MNKDNKHPLDPEELFKRLNDQQPGSDGPLDDFEKEALEGFAMLGDEQQARDAYKEVLVRLSKKNSATQKPERKTRVVWLSAAAMVAVMLIVGVVWLNNSHGPAHHDLAMNEPQKNVISNPAEEPLPSAVETEEPVNEPARVISAKQKEASVTSPDLGQDIAKTAYAPPVFEKQLEDREQADEKPKEIVRKETANTGISAKGEAAVTYEGYAADTKNNEGPGTVFREENGKSLAKAADKADVSPYKGKAKDEEKDQGNHYDSDKTVSGNPDNVATATTTSPVLSETDSQQEVVVSKNEGKKRAEKTNNATPAAAGDYAATKAQAVPNVDDYYNPGEKALKNYAVTKAGSKTLSGTYTIKASVSGDGRLKVTSVTATGGSCSDCAQTLKKILDGMSGWQASPGLVFNLTF